MAGARSPGFIRNRNRVQVRSIRVLLRGLKICIFLDHDHLDLFLYSLYS